MNDFFSSFYPLEKLQFGSDDTVYFEIPNLFINDIFISLHHLWLHFRLLWFILFGFAIWYGYLLYTPFLDAWYYEPTVIATDQADFPVEKLPFPAITICSNNKIVYRQLESVLRTQPWKGLMSLNWNETQATNNGRLNNNL